jgi:hypothetical protein
VRINCSWCGDQMFDLHLCLSASVNVMPILHTRPLGLYKILVWYLFVHRYFSSPPLFFLISSILQMVNTRNRNANSENNDVENNNAATPPPTLEQVWVMQAQILQTIQQTMVNMQNAQHQALPLPLRDRLGDFQRTKHRHCRRGIDLETFSAPSRLLSLTVLSRWMQTISSSL